MKLFSSEIFWSALSAFGTIGAVIVALWQILKPKKRKLVVNESTSDDLDIGRFEYTVTVDNVGDTSVIIKECGFARKPNSNCSNYLACSLKSLVGRFIKVKDIDTSFNLYIKNQQFPLMIKSGESALIEYSIMVPNFQVENHTIVASDKQINRELTIFRNALFVVRDTLLKTYF